MRTKLIGYIVISPEGTPGEYYSYDDGPKFVIVRGDGATLFNSRKTARKAIQRSVKFGEENKLDGWIEIWGDSFIWPVYEFPKEG